MLNELSELQSSDERYMMTKMGFTVMTRANDSGELIEKEYTFSWAPEWDEWRFYEYEERRTEDVDRIGDRNWRTSRHVWWEDMESIDVEIPQRVSDELAERLGCDEVNISL